MSPEVIQPYLLLLAGTTLFVLFIWVVIRMVKAGATAGVLWCIGLFALICFGVLPATAWFRSGSSPASEVPASKRPTVAKKRNTKPKVGIPDQETLSQKEKSD